MVKILPGTFLKQPRRGSGVFLVDKLVQVEFEGPMVDYECSEIEEMFVHKFRARWVRHSRTNLPSRQVAQTNGGRIR